MGGAIKTSLKRFVFWEYPRGSRQYDVIVVLILAFIFLTPRAWFRDQPRVPRANKIAMLPDENGSANYWIDPELLAGVPDNQRAARLSQLLKGENGRWKPVLRLQPIYDESEQELKGYVAFTTPE